MSESECYHTITGYCSVCSYLIPVVILTTESEWETYLINLHNDHRCPECGGEVRRSING